MFNNQNQNNMRKFLLMMIGLLAFMVTPKIMVQAAAINAPPAGKMLLKKDSKKD